MPYSVNHVQCLLGFANLYRKFIKGYSNVFLPLTQLTQKNQSFVWTSGVSTTFDNLKQVVTSSPILVHVDLEL